jgi:hypothetical protein
MDRQGEMTMTTQINPEQITHWDLEPVQYLYRGHYIK